MYKYYIIIPKKKFSSMGFIVKSFAYKTFLLFRAAEM